MTELAEIFNPVFVLKAQNEQIVHDVQEVVKQVREMMQVTPEIQGHLWSYSCYPPIVIGMPMMGQIT